MTKFYYNGCVFDCEPDPCAPFKNVIIKHPIYGSSMVVKIEDGRLFNDSVPNMDSVAVEEDIIQMVRKISVFEGGEGTGKAQHIRMRKLQKRIQEGRQETDY